MVTEIVNCGALGSQKALRVIMDNSTQGTTHFKIKDLIFYYTIFFCVCNFHFKKDKCI